MAASSCVWFNNLAKEMTEDQFKAFAGAAGPITEVDYGRGNRMAWVTYANPAAAAKAVTFAGKELVGRAVRTELATRDTTQPKPVRAPRPPRAAPVDGAAPETYVDRIVVRNVPRGTTEESIRAFFRTIPADAITKVASDRGLTRVRFDSEATAAKALALSGSKLGDVEVTCELEFKRKRSSKRGGGGAAAGGAEGGAAPARAAPPARGTRAVIIRGLAAGTTADALKAQFASAGRIENATITADGTGGSLTFDEPSGAEKAVTMSAGALTVELRKKGARSSRGARAAGVEGAVAAPRVGAGRRRKTAEEGEGEDEAPAVDVSSTVWVSGLAEGATEESVKALFVEYGVTSIRFMGARGPTSKAFAYVVLETAEDSQDALELNGKDGLIVQAARAPGPRRARRAAAE